MIADRRHADAATVVAVAASIYCGFRLNEVSGTDLVLHHEPAAAALRWLQTVNAHRSIAVMVMVSLTGLTSILLLVTSIQSRHSISRVGLVAGCCGVALVALEDYLTFAVHVPIAGQIEGMRASELDRFIAIRDDYITHDVERSLVLALAVVCFVLAARWRRNSREST